RGGSRISGHLAADAHPERIAVDRVEVTLDRLARRDPLPKELKLSGSFVYTPDQVGWRNLHVSGQTFALDTHRGHVAIESGRLDVPGVNLRGKGSALERVVHSFGLGASLDEAGARMRLGGTLRRPEVSGGELSIAGFEISGRRFTEGSSGFAVHNGVL